MRKLRWERGGGQIVKIYEWKMFTTQKFTNFNWFNKLDSPEFLQDESGNKIPHEVVPQVNKYKCMNYRHNVPELFCKNIKC